MTVWTPKSLIVGDQDRRNLQVTVSLTLLDMAERRSTVTKINARSLSPSLSLSLSCDVCVGGLA